MNKAILFASIAATALAAAPVAAATTISGTVSSVTVNNTDPGLVINAAPVAFPSFTLTNAGDFADYTVLTIGTPEGTVNIPEDFSPRPISVAFAFSSPTGATGAPITGNTLGFINLNLFGSCGIIAGGCGQAIFNAPSVFNFGQGGQFSVALSNATFATPGTASVTGRFTLISNAVPEPSTWALMLLGFGAVGAAMRSPKRRRMTVAYA